MANQNVQDEFAALQLEQLRDTVTQIRRRRQSRLNRLAALRQAAESQERQTQADQALCHHRKGGRGPNWRLNGNDPNYAIVQHTYSHGPTVVCCLRCKKEWSAPAALKRGASVEERAASRKQLDEYRWAMALPTDNEPSGTRLFDFIQEAA